MHYQRTSKPSFDPKVREIQSLLNCALFQANALVRVDFPGSRTNLTYPPYSKRLRHMERVPSTWHTINPDGFYGQNTETAVKGLQSFLLLSVNGVMDDQTFSRMGDLITLSIPTPSQLTPSLITTKPTSRIQNDSINTFKQLLTSWENVGDALSSVTYVLGMGFVIFGERNMDIYLHVNFNQIVRDLLNANNGRTPQQWFRVNDKGRFRQFTSYRVSKLADNISGKLGTVGNALGVFNCLIETKDAMGKLFKGKLKFIDTAKLSIDYLDTTLGIALRNVSTMGLSVKQSITTYGSHVVKWKYASRLGTVGAGATAAGVVVVAIQCVSAFMVGWSIGDWIESKTHIGEKSMNYLWELFIGDLVTKYYEWRTSKIIVLKFPEDWTDQQIREFMENSKTK